MVKSSHCLIFSLFGFSQQGSKQDRPAVPGWWHSGLCRCCHLTPQSGPSQNRTRAAQCPAGFQGASPPQLLQALPGPCGLAPTREGAPLPGPPALLRWAHPTVQWTPVGSSGASPVLRPETPAVRHQPCRLLQAVLFAAIVFCLHPLVFWSSWGHSVTEGFRTYSSVRFWVCLFQFLAECFSIFSLCENLGKSKNFAAAIFTAIFAK